MDEALPFADFAGLIPGAALAALGAQPDRVRVLRGGRQANLCLRVATPAGERVLRIRQPRAVLPGADFAREVACHEAAAAAGLAPPVLASDVDRGWMLLPFVPQAPWTRDLLEEPGRAERLCRRLARLHAVPVPPGPREFDAGALVEAHRARLTARGIAAEGALRDAAALAREFDGPARRAPVLCHGDPDVGNLLGPIPLLIDFEYAQIADPLYDLALLVAYYPFLEAVLDDLLAAAALPDPADRAEFPKRLDFARQINALWGLALD